MIEGSIKKVELGTKIANSTAESLEQIVNEVTKAASLVGEIATASNEQTTAIAQINKGIEQVSEVVQTNAATAEESNLSYDNNNKKSAYSESAVTKVKPKIFLGDNDFGKY